jgi:ankyrin repeat protein
VGQAKQDGWTALNLAFQNGHRAVAELLLPIGWSFRTQRGGTLLVASVAVPFALVVVGLFHWRLSFMRKLLYTFFLVACAAIGWIVVGQARQARQDGETALMYACKNGHRDVAELLLDRGADVGQAQQGGWTALMLARAKAHADVIELLLSRGA